MVGPRRGRGMQKKLWVEVIRQEMLHLQLTDDMTLRGNDTGTTSTGLSVFFGTLS